MFAIIATAKDFHVLNILRYVSRYFYKILIITDARNGYIDYQCIKLNYYTGTAFDLIFKIPSVAIE
jgi:hypothetical protein